MNAILSGRNTLELRSKNHSYAGQRIYFVEKASGWVRGTAVLANSHALTAAEREANQAALDYRGYAWPLQAVVRLVAQRRRRREGHEPPEGRGGTVVGHNFQEGERGGSRITAL